MNANAECFYSTFVCSYRGRRDSCAQITDGTIGTMTVETTSTFFDSSTQTGKTNFTPHFHINYAKPSIFNSITWKKFWKRDVGKV